MYGDGNDFTVHVAGRRGPDNHAHEGGGAIIFVSNDRTGTVIISSTLQWNPSAGFENPPASSSSAAVRSSRTRSSE